MQILRLRQFSGMRNAAQRQSARRLKRRRQLNRYNRLKSVGGSDRLGTQIEKNERRKVDRFRANRVNAGKTVSARRAEIETRNHLLGLSR